MTLVRLGIYRPTPEGTDVLASGRIEWTPTARHIDGPDVILPAPFSVRLTEGVTEVIDIDATTNEWVWRVKEYTQGGITRYVSVPNVGTTLNYAELTDVDPETLDPTATPEAAWWVALEQLQLEGIDPAVIEAAVQAAMNDHVDSPTPNPAYDTIPSLALIFQNGLA